LYFVVLLSFVPILKFTSEIVNTIDANKKVVSALAYFLVLVSCEPLLENLYLVAKTFDGNASLYISEVYDAQATGEKNVGDSINQGMTWLGRKLNVINIYAKDLIPILFFYFLTLGKKNKFLIYGLGVAMLNPILHSYVHAVRVGIVTQLFYIVYLFILFKNSIDTKIYKKVLVLGGSIGGGIALLVILITIFRYENDAGMVYPILDWISLYIGEGMLNFNSQMWDVKISMLGDSSFPLLKYVLGLDTFTDNLDNRTYWGARTGINMMVFNTFIGDFYADMGALGTLIFILLVSTVLLRYIRVKKEVPLHRVVLLSIWFKVCLLGFTYYTFKVFTSNLYLLFMILIYFVLKISHKKKKMRKYPIPPKLDRAIESQSLTNN